jgi:hypothetical protein
VDLPRGVTLYWRVRANGTNGPSAWSTPRSLTSANPPSVPGLVSPANGALVMTYTPTLDWGNSTGGGGVDHYTVQIAENAGFSVGLRQVDEPASTHLVSPALLPNKTYWWRVRSENAVGEYSLWSAVRTFRTVIPAPLLNSPSDGEDVLTTRPLFDWGDVSGASGYTLQVSSVATFASTVVNVTPGASQYTPSVDLPRGVTLYWRVRANGTNGPSAWSTPRSLTSANPPSVPGLVSPANGALVMTYTPTLDWGNSTGGGGVDHYTVQIAENSGFSVGLRQVDELASMHVASPALAPNKTYWWRVRSENAAGEYSLWSAARTLRTVIVAPGIISPTNGTVLTSLRPVFDWTDVAGATSYALQVSTNNQFSSFVLNVSPTNSTYTPSANLPTNKVLDVRLRANGPNGPSAWSTLSFIIIP